MAPEHYCCWRPSTYYMASLNLKLKVLDFVKSGGPACTVLRLSLSQRTTHQACRRRNLPVNAILTPNRTRAKKPPAAPAITHVETLVSTSVVRFPASGSPADTSLIRLVSTITPGTVSVLGSCLEGASVEDIELPESVATALEELWSSASVESAEIGGLICTPWAAPIDTGRAWEPRPFSSRLLTPIVPLVVSPHHSHHTSDYGCHVVSYGCERTIQRPSHRCPHGCSYGAGYGCERTIQPTHCRGYAPGDHCWGTVGPHKKLVQPHRRYTPATTMPPAIAPIANPPITISATARAESCAPPLSVSGGLGFTAGSATATGVPASVEDHGPSATPFTARTCTSYTVSLVSDRILYLKGGVPVPRVQASSTNSHSAPPLGRAGRRR